MTLLYPWLLALIPLVWWLMSRHPSRTSLKVPSLKLWPNTSAGKARFLWIPPLLRKLAATLVIVALARPQTTSSFSQNISEGIAIQMLVDVSSSMDMNVSDAEGNPTTRMELAKTIVETFIAGDGQQLQGRPDDLIGLISFARYADTRSPLTFGHQALLQIVRNLQIQERPNEDGTAYGDAIAIAAARLKKLDELEHSQSHIDADAIKSRVIILLTDGENNSGAHLPLEAAGLAKEWDCRIYAISLGSSDSLPNTDSPPGQLSAAEQTLEHISNETGGIFRQAHDFESLKSVYAEINQLETAKMTTRSYEHLAEGFWLPLSLALAALTLALTLEASVLRVVP